MFEKNPELSRFSYSPNMPGVSTGNGTLDILISILLSGMKLPAIPGKGQSVYDAMLMRDRSRDYLTVMQKGFAEQLIMQKLGGFNTSSTFGQAASLLLGKPDGIMDSSIMRAFNGGNPVKAMMSLNAGMTGQTMAMTFGMHGNATPQEVMAMYEGYQRQLYKQHTINSGDVDKLVSGNQTEFAKTLDSNAAAKSFFKEFSTKDGFDFDAFKKKAKEYAEKAKDSANQGIIDAYDEAFKRSESIASMRDKVGRQVSTRVDGEATRGFQTDDIISGSIMMKDLGLSYDVKNRFSSNAKHNPELAKRATAGVKNEVAVIAAMRDLTGSSDYKELVSMLNEMLGNSVVNFQSDQQANQIEHMVRTYKATARTLGISAQAMDGMLATNKALISQYGALKYMGGTAAVDLTINTAKQGSAFIAAMGPDWARRNGGSAQVMQELQANAVDNRGSAPVTHMAALAALVQASDLSADEKEKLFKDISASAQTANAFTPTNRYKLLDRVGAKIGMSRNQILAAQQESTTQQAGMDFAELRRRDGKDLGLDQAAISADFANFRAYAMDALARVKINGKPIDAKAEFLGFMQDVEKGEKLEQAAVRHHMNMSPVISAFLRSNKRHNIELYAISNSKVYKDNKKLIDQATSASATEEAKMAAKFNSLQTPLFNQVAQELISGNLGKGVDALQDLFVTDASRDRTASIFSSARDLQGEDTDANFLRAYYELHGGAAGISGSALDANLDASYISDPKDRRRVIAQRQSMSAEGLTTLTEVSKKLTINQILAGAKNWEGSMAKGAGLSRKDVQAAAEIIKQNNWDSESNLAQYGGQSFNKVRRNILVGSAIGEAGRIAAADIITSAEKSSGEKFTQFLADAKDVNSGKYNEYKSALDTLGLYKDKTGPVNKLKNTGLAVLSGLFGYYAPVTKLASEKKEIDMHKLVTEMNKDEKDMTPAEKAAVATLKKSKELTNTAKTVKEAEARAVEGREAAKSAAGQADLSNLTSVMGSSSQSITSAIEKLTDMLRSFNGGGV